MEANTTTSAAAAIYPVDQLAHIAGRILAAHDSGNNGAVMGEATLCRYFAEGLRAALAAHKAQPAPSAADVAELVRAVTAFKGKRGAFMALGADDERTIRLWAALAKFGGGQ